MVRAQAEAHHIGLKHDTALRELPHYRRLSNEFYVARYALTTSHSPPSTSMWQSSDLSSSSLTNCIGSHLYGIADAKCIYPNDRRSPRHGRMMLACRGHS